MFHRVRVEIRFPNPINVLLTIVTVLMYIFCASSIQKNGNALLFDHSLLDFELYGY